MKTTSLGRRESNWFLLSLRVFQVFVLHECGASSVSLWFLPLLKVIVVLREERIAQLIWGGGLVPSFNFQHFLVDGHAKEESEGICSSFFHLVSQEAWAKRCVWDAGFPSLSPIIVSMLAICSQFRKRSSLLHSKKLIDVAQSHFVYFLNGARSTNLRYFCIL